MQFSPNYDSIPDNLSVDAIQALRNDYLEIVSFADGYGQYDALSYSTLDERLSYWTDGEYTEDEADDYDDQVAVIEMLIQYQEYYNSLCKFFADLKALTATW